MPEEKGLFAGLFDFPSRDSSAGKLSSCFTSSPWWAAELPSSPKWCSKCGEHRTGLLALVAGVVAFVHLDP